MATSQANVQSDPAVSGIKVLHTKTCPSLSGKNIITYKLGLDAENVLYVRLHGNSGGGFFNDDWYAAQEIVALLRALGKVEFLTSRAIAPLAQGRSANTPAFLMAVLRNEGALLPYKRTSRYHVIGDLDAFLNQADALPSNVTQRTQRKPAPKAKPTPRKTSKKTSSKKR